MITKQQQPATKKLKLVGIGEITLGDTGQLWTLGEIKDIETGLANRLLNQPIFQEVTE
jgi:hypothetical protein